MAFAEIEPFGSFVDDYRAGIGPAVAVNMNRAPPKDGEAPPPPVNAFSWFPWRQIPKVPEPEIESPAVLSARIRAMFTRAGKAAKRKLNG